MDFLPQMTRSNKNKRKRSMDSLLKVVYISSPMKVKTSASRFRTLVQELTGRDSDISRFMDTSRDHVHQDFEILPDNKRVSKSINNNYHNRRIDSLSLSSSSSLSFLEPHRDSPSSSDSFQEQPPTFDDAFINEQYFQGLLSADLFCDSSDLDVLGSYDTL